MAGTAMHIDKGQQWLPLAFLSFAFLAWSTALAGPFQFDDHNVIVDFAPVHSLSAWWHSLPGIRPLLKLSYALNWSLSPSPLGFHLFNVLVHLLNGLLLLVWARRVLPLHEGMALLLMLLWLLHPLQTEAVTYVAGRSVSLSTTFLLAGLALLAQECRGARYGAAVCTLLALAVRETAWIFPLLFALVEYLRGAGWRSAFRTALPAGLVVGLAALAFLAEPHYRHLIDVSLATRDVAAQLRAQIVGLSYLLQQLFSLAPNIDPDLRVPERWSALLMLQGMLLLSGFVGSLYFTLRHRSWRAAGMLWFFLVLVPTNSFMPRLDVANDRHLYGALIGPLWSLLLSLPPWRCRAAAVFVLAALFATATLIRNEDYRSELALWARTAGQSPEKARVWNNLGMACREAGQSDCAAAAFAHAMTLDPDDPRPAVNLYFLSRGTRQTGP
jgi:hypothetical protein